MDQTSEIRERFFAKTIPEPNSGCLLWTGATRGTMGYGCFSFGGRQENAHRVAWQLKHGPIPEGIGYHGICVLHRCDTPLCVNADHLFLGTNSDNVQDAIRKGRHRPGFGAISGGQLPFLGERNRAKTHCPNGHLYDDDNTYRRPGRANWRECRECKKAARKGWREKARERRRHAA